MDLLDSILHLTSNQKDASVNWCGKYRFLCVKKTNVEKMKVATRYHRLCDIDVI